MAQEQISIFDMFKIGIGPSSSHTLGPWRAAQRFIHALVEKDVLSQAQAVHILLYGSLAKTGIGHGTDIAVLLGLSGDDPVTFDTHQVIPKIEQIKNDGKICLGGIKEIDFSYSDQLLFLFDQSLPFHPNAVTFQAFLEDGAAISETYYSIGGGFVTQENDNAGVLSEVDLPFPIDTASELISACMRTGLKISDLVLENELSWRTEQETRTGVLQIFQVIKDCIYTGCHSGGVLPGGLNVERRAARLNKRIVKDRS
ncbi:MAG TPA: serine dehydratase beta chain, partial [Sphingobacterium sp.]|nr:serine dehydratase beta chain [Sphingobacterium sp.]